MKQMAFDFKKEYKEFYLPKNKPQIKQRDFLNMLFHRLKAFGTVLQVGI